MESNFHPLELDELNEQQRTYLSHVFQILEELQFPIPLKWQWEFLTSLFLSTFEHMKAGEDSYLDRYVLCGANGTGKTAIALYASLALMIWMHRTFPGERLKGMIMSGSEDQLRNVFWNDLTYLIKTTAAQHHFNITSSSCSLKENSFIYLAPRVVNVGNLHSLAGVHAEAALVVLEESTAIPNQTLEKIYTYFAGNKGKSCKGFLILTGNPTSKDSFFYNAMEGGENEWRGDNSTQALESLGLG